jgi:hypothetical protein
MSLAEVANLESHALNHMMSTADAVEGGTAYFERRPPQWSASINKDWPQWLKD